MLTVSLIYIFLFITGQLTATCLRIKIHKKTQLGMLILTAIALSVVAFHFEPMESDDLYRHFLSVNAYRTYSDSVYAQAQYSSPLIAWKRILMFVSNLKSNHYLPAMIVLTDYIIFSYNYYVISKKVKINRTVFFLYFLLHFAMVQYVSIFSGLRNVFVFFISGAILLRKIFLGEKIIKYIPVIIMGMFIHPAILIPFVLYYVSLFAYKHKLVYGALVFWPMLVKVILLFLGKLNISYLNLVVRKLNDYITFSNPVDHRKRLVELGFLVFVFLQLLLLKNKKYSWPPWAKKYTEFLMCLIAFMISSFFCAYYLEERTMIFLGIIYLPMVQLFRDLFKNSLWKFFAFLQVFQFC